MDPALLEYLRKMAGPGLPEVQPATDVPPPSPAPASEGWSQMLDQAMTDDKAAQHKAEAASIVRHGADTFLSGRPTPRQAAPKVDDGMRGFLTKYGIGKDEANRAGQERGREADLLRFLAGQAGQDRRTEAERAFRAAEADEARSFTAGENEKNRSVTREGHEKSRQPKPADPADLRKEFQGQKVYKDTQEAATYLRKIRNAGASGAGDIALVFSFMKMIEPTSTVREGEYATAEEAPGKARQFLNLYNKLIKGERLPPAARTQFRTQASQLFKDQYGQYEATAGGYRRLATESGLRPEDVILDAGFSGLMEDEQAGATAEAPTRKVVGDKTYEKRADGWYEVE